MLIERTKDKIIQLELHKVFAYFLVFGFLGWIFETMYVWIGQGRFTFRGYFFVQQPFSYYFSFLRSVPFISKIPMIWGLPFIELYGFGGVIMAVLFGHQKDRPVTLFIMGMMTMTLLELVGSYMCTSLLNTRYWDYSTNFMNFEGRICLLSSFAWGALSVIGVSIVMPRIDRLYQKLSDKKWLEISIAILILYAVFCALYKYLLA